MDETPTGTTGIRLSSRARLNRRATALFPGDSLFERVARALCEAECLPRKELFESWEMARRVRRRFRGGRVIDLACGHGLLAHLLLLLDDTSASAIACDRRLPPSAPKVARAMVDAWPRLDRRVELREASIGEVPLQPGDLVVSAHACGELSDTVLQRAVAVRARIAVLPCCQQLSRPERDPLEGWMEGALAIDVRRLLMLREAGYRVHASRLPAAITEKNRLLLGEPG